VPPIDGRNTLLFESRTLSFCVHCASFSRSSASLTPTASASLGRCQTGSTATLMHLMLPSGLTICNAAKQHHRKHVRPCNGRRVLIVLTRPSRRSLAMISGISMFAGVAEIDGRALSMPSGLRETIGAHAACVAGFCRCE
jgi:hypothetical protein